jgi:hypothetical protein
MRLSPISAWFSAVINFLPIQVWDVPALLFALEGCDVLISDLFAGWRLSVD